VVDPVVSRYGDSFERAAIFEWMEEGNTHCPITGQPLRASCLVSNKQLVWKIRCWMRQRGKEVADPEKAEFHESFTTVGAIVPEKYKCDLTKKLMSDPVMTASGSNFERKAILEYLENHDTCPVTQQPLFPSKVVTNHALKHEIADWKAKNADHGDGLPGIDLEEDAMILLSPFRSPNGKRRAVIGTRDDPAVMKMRENHAQRLKELGLPDDEDEDNAEEGLPLCG
jgi:U-box domain